MEKQLYQSDSLLLSAVSLSVLLLTAALFAAQTTGVPLSGWTGIFACRVLAVVGLLQCLIALWDYLRTAKPNGTFGHVVFLSNVLSALLLVMAQSALTFVLLRGSTK